MTAQIIDGKAFAKQLRHRIAEHVERLKTDHGLTPGLAVVIVGEDPASQVYVNSKSKQTKEVGMNSFKYELPKDVGEEELLKLIDELNERNDVNGILVQLPVPDHIDADKIIKRISPAKDVDCFTPENVGRLAIGLPGPVSCTPLGSLMLLRDQLGNLEGLNAVIIGRSNLVGKPMSQLLLRDNCTVTVAHSRTKDLPGLCRTADIIVAAVGRPEMIKGDWIKPGATVIDVGINRWMHRKKARAKPSWLAMWNMRKRLRLRGRLLRFPVALADDHRVPVGQHHHHHMSRQWPHAPQRFDSIVH